VKNLPKSFYLVICLLLSACGQVPSSPIPTPAIVASLTPRPSATIRPIREPKWPEESRPTVFPTIEPTQLPGMLKKAFSVQPLDSINGHTLRRITGWSYAYNDYGGRAEPYFTNRYQWMDSSHLLLFPKTGVIRNPNWDTVQKRAVVINFETGKVWLPPEQPEQGYTVLDISLPRWSPEAGVLISSENIRIDHATKAGAMTYTPEGKPVGFYPGELLGISPSGNKILVDDAWVDLKSGKIVDFAWYFGVGARTWLPAWSSDETRVYMCCYFYGDANTGESYSLTDGDKIFEGQPIDQSPTSLRSLHHSNGKWLNDRYVLAKADGFYTYMTGFEPLIIPIFDPSARTYRDLRKLAGLPDPPDSVGLAPYEIDISPKGDYLWMRIPTDANSYLVDMKTFQARNYPEYTVQWSENGKYAIIASKLLDLSSRTSKAMPANMVSCIWHPTKSICLNLFTEADQKQGLTFLNAQNMQVQEISLPAGVSYSTAIWSPAGNHIALLTKDQALWQIDYPALTNPEQLTRPMKDINIHALTWSPDGSHLSFVDGTDIYIVDANVSP
jgi:hypothetical protein